MFVNLNFLQKASYSKGRLPLGTLPARAATQLPNVFEVGNRLGAYCIEKAIGRGGMGEVYQAFRHDLGIKVALKVWSPHLGQTQEGFLSERRMLSKLNHPNIIRMYDGGTTEEGWPWFAMEWVPGLTLDSWQRIYQPSVWECLELMVKVVDALAYAHRMHIVHFDLKPANILVDPRSGAAKVLDFGIAWSLTSNGLSTRQAGSGLTPQYASPEQLAARPLNQLSDIYSLAVVFNELLTPSGNANEVVGTNLEVGVKPGHSRIPGLSKDRGGWLRKRLLKVLDPCLEEQGHRRVSSLDLVLGELRHLQWLYWDKVCRQQLRGAIVKRYLKAFRRGLPILAMLVMSPVRETAPEPVVWVGSCTTIDDSNMVKPWHDEGHGLASAQIGHWVSPPGASEHQTEPESGDRLAGDH